MRFFCFLILLAADSFAAVTPAFQLGVNYSEWLPFPANNGAQLATDPTGAIYFLSNTVESNVSVSTVTKLTPDGKTILWQNQPGFGVSAISVDPMGGVYVALTRLQSGTPGYVAKLSANGTGLAWKMALGFLPEAPIAIAADSEGRLCFTAALSILDSTANVGRVNAAGTAIDFLTTIKGTPASIAVDPAGTSYVAGTGVNPQGATVGFLGQVESNGSAGYYTVLPVALTGTVAVDGNGNVSLFGFGVLQRIDSNGAVALTTPLPAPAVAFALDAAGNAYVAETTDQLYHATNSIATCLFNPATPLSSYSQVLEVISPGGSVLQATYLPGGDNLGSPVLAVTPGGTVLIAAIPGPGFTPTQSGPFPPAAGNLFLSNLSQTSADAPAPAFSLTCAGNSASFILGPVSPGELVSLFGSGLGPGQGVAVDDNPPNPYPTQAANVRVTFDGIPAPLLYVQDAQINAVAPWSITPGQNTVICATYNNVTTNCLTLPVAAATPAVFMVDGQHAAAINQDGSYNTADNPAAVGSIVSIWATGLGPITPAQADGALIGLPLPTNNLVFGVEAGYTLPPSGIITEYVPFNAQYAGPAPTLVAGVSQINFEVGSFPSFGMIVLYMGSTSSLGFSIYIAGQ